MKTSQSVYTENWLYAFYKSILTPSLRPAFKKCVPSIIYNFFLRQYHAAFLPGRIPVTSVDHELDKKIPFVPSWVTIYLDFVQFWIRMITFFIRRYKRRAYQPLKEFIVSMGDLYAYAAEVYKRNMSTTKRPFYIARPRFFVIHLLDPHLMCIPSLHVMVVIHTYLQFANIAKKLGESENLKDQAAEMKNGALAISQAILFVKQHSVNCIPAALYAMTCFSPELFPPSEAEAFTNLLFSPAPKADEKTRKNRVHPSASPNTKIKDEDQAQIKAHILSIYQEFLEEKKNAKKWYDPILKFLKEYKA
ncbi:MAG: hypothetical protein FWD28_04040 [Treponema sp.]|nr:hypothetical protein [Treponema sp.]